MVYNKKTQRKRSKSASKSRRRSRGGDIEDGKPAPHVAALMKPPNRSISPTNAPLPTYDQAMNSRRPTTSTTKPVDPYDAAEKGQADFVGPNLVGGKRRKGKRSKKRRKGKRSKKTRKGKRSKKTRKGKKSTKKKSLFGKLFGL